MKTVRMLLHPIMGNSRSFSIFLFNLVAALVSFSILGHKFFAIVESAGLDLKAFPTDANMWLSLLLSPLTHFVIVIASILLGTGFTAIYVVGPIRRIEEWLIDWEAGHELRPLKLRTGDEIYENIVQMMNTLHEKKAQSKRASRR